jgi:hypothetical protein
MITKEQSAAYCPEIQGWSEDILPFYDDLAEALPDGSVCVEVGSWHGRSIRYWAHAFATRGKHAVKLYCIDPSVEGGKWGQPDGLHDDWGHLLSNLAAAPPEERALIHPVRTISVRAAKMFGRREVAAAFIDGNHEEPFVRDDIQVWLPTIKMGGIISGHDYGAAPGVTEAVNEAFRQDELEIRDSVWSWRVR